MAKNPLFPDDDNSDDQADKSPAANDTPEVFDYGEKNSSVNLIRKKLEALYGEEPSAKREIVEVESVAKPLSKHQQYMLELNESGKSLAEIQVAWHEYYEKLSDKEKHEVWQEFYDAQGQTSNYAARSAEAKEQGRTKAVVPSVRERPSSVSRRPKPIKHQSSKHVSQHGRLKAKEHFKSLGFGLVLGAIVIVVFLFSFFNEYLIAPFIQPSRQLSSTPLIVSANGIAATKRDEVIIPKINVQIPVNYNLRTDDENVIEDALESGVVHYPSTVYPGQNGNAAYFGHSSNNIFNPGKYKFAFVLLHKLVPGDTFYLTYNGKVFVYQVIARRIVSPNDVAVLNQTLGKQATATLITCDPPGTSLHRLVVTGEQISPAVSGNTAGAPTAAATQPAQIVGNGPSLWSRFWDWVF